MYTLHHIGLLYYNILSPLQMNNSPSRNSCKIENTEMDIKTDITSLIQIITSANIISKLDYSNYYILLSITI